MQIDGTSVTLNHRTWGNPTHPALVCVHGLTRNSLDFHFIGEALKERFYVIAPDMPGRGESPPLDDALMYNNGFYAKAIVQWMSDLNIKTCNWLGTSMGGLIGMVIAATDPTRITRMVLNDIGAMIPAAARARLKTYVGREMQFANRTIAESRLREIFAPFGLTEEHHWKHLINSSIKETPDGSCTMRYDPRIAEVFLPMADEDLDLWPLFNAVTCPTLLLRGTNSDLLLHETAVQMAEKPNVKLIEIPNCGHAPALYSDEQIKLVAGFL